MSIKAGVLRHRVTIQKRSDVQDPITGEMQTSWVDVFSSVPAEIAPLSAREFIAAQSMQSQVIARARIRYREGIQSSMRLIHNGTIYNIAGVLSDAQSGLSYITLPLSAGVNDG